MKGNANTFNSFNDTGRSTLISKDRRRFLGDIAVSCGGLAGTAIASFNPLLRSPAAAQAAPHNLQAPRGQSKVVAADEATVVETLPGRSEDSSETAFISSRVFPTAHPVRVRTASFRQ